MPHDEPVYSEDDLTSLTEENAKLRLDNDDLRQELAAVYESNRQLQTELLVQKKNIYFFFY